MNFGEALEKLKSGYKLCRKGWNGKGIYIELQVPDEHSKMTLPYIYIVTNNLVTNNPDAPKGIVPWLGSQTDLLAEDWQILGQEIGYPLTPNTVVLTEQNRADCSKCVHFELEGIEGVCNEFNQVIEDAEPLCSAYEPTEELTPEERQEEFEAATIGSDGE
jgi:hypothetical protein